MLSRVSVLSLQLSQLPRHNACGCISLQLTWVSYYLRSQPSCPIFTTPSFYTPHTLVGGMGYIASNESALLVSNTTITANVVRACLAFGIERLFVASSACVYPQALQAVTGVAPPLREDQAWPADPQDGYGLEKLYGEELALRAAVGLPPPGLAVRIARFHNVYGPRGSWVGGREKAPAAFLRKALMLRALDRANPAQVRPLEVWGDGSQVRTFCFIDDAVDGVLLLMCSDAATPVNIGSTDGCLNN